MSNDIKILPSEDDFVLRPMDEPEHIADTGKMIEEQIDNVPMDFIVWYYGMERTKIKRAYLRWVRETFPEMPTFPTPNS